MVVHYTHDTRIYALRACPFSYGRDLIAIGGERGVDILIADDSDCRAIASFHTGCRVTALAWSPKSVSPSSNNEWILELVAAGSDYGMYLLRKMPTSEESIFRFGGGLTGHHGRVNDIAFCGGHGENGQRYVGSVSDDKMLMVWDLYPNVPVQLQQERPQPTAYAITFSHALVSIDAHVSSDKEFLVADCKGSVYITDWRTDPENSGRLGFYSSNILELTDPSALVSSAGVAGSASWRPDNADVIGATYGSWFSVWDTRNLQGGKPLRSGLSFTHGGHHFRWCPTHPEYFAIASAPNQDAIIHVYNFDYVNAQQISFHVASKPHVINDMDFVCLQGLDRIAVAVDCKLYFFDMTLDK